MTSTDARDLKAVLWDMDGTLVDTEPYWMAAQRDLAGTHGVEWTADNARSTVGQAGLQPGRHPRGIRSRDEVVVVPGVVQPSAAAGRHFVTSLEDVTVESLRTMLRR